MRRIAVARHILATRRVREADVGANLTTSHLPVATVTTPGRRRYVRHAPTALLAIATMAVTIRTPITTALEQQQRDYGTQAQAQNQNREQKVERNGSDDCNQGGAKSERTSTTGECLAYGCRFVPRDVFYDAPTKEALGKIRSMERDEVLKLMASDHTDATSRNKLATLNTLGTHQAATLTLIGYKGGPMDTQINQDRAICVDGFRFPSMPDDQTENRLLGVFDGHANLGELVSEFSVTNLPVLLANKLQRIYEQHALGQEDPSSHLKKRKIKDEDVKQALIDIFVQLDRDAPAQVSGGCTASVVLQLGRKIFVANAGDSQSFIVTYRPSTKKTSVVYMSREDKPDLPDERARVEAAGGSVYAPPRGTSRVIYTDPRTRMQSGLAMSRSIGDWEAGKVGVIPNPLVDIIDIDSLVNRRSEAPDECELMDQEGNMVENCCEPTSAELDQAQEQDIYVFAVSATDGLLDFSTPSTIAEQIASSLCEKDGQHLLSAIEQMIYMAAQGWERAKSGRYRDDIAIAVALIHQPPSYLKNHEK